MNSYKKPTIVGYNSTYGIFPLAAAAPILAGLAAGGITVTTGIAATSAAVAAGAAALGGAAVGAALAKSGKITIDEPIVALTARKEFVFG